jgi:hypothetical protein
MGQLNLSDRSAQIPARVQCTVERRQHFSVDARFEKVTRNANPEPRKPAVEPAHARCGLDGHTRRVAWIGAAHYVLNESGVLHGRGERANLIER